MGAEPPLLGAGLAGAEFWGCEGAGEFLGQLTGPEFPFPLPFPKLDATGGPRVFNTGGFGLFQYTGRFELTE